MNYKGWTQLLKVSSKKALNSDGTPTEYYEIYRRLQKLDQSLDIEQVKVDLLYQVITYTEWTRLLDLMAHKAFNIHKCPNSYFENFQYMQIIEDEIRR